MKLNKEQFDQYMQNCWKRYIEVGKKCQVCGKEIKQLKYINIAHTEKRGKDIDAILNRFVICCEELHIWQHDRPNNLSNHPCVRLFQLNYWNGSGTNKFWQRFIKERGLFDYD